MKRPAVKRLNIVQGQVRGLKILVENQEDCEKVITQFKAANSALKKAMREYLKENIQSCINNVDEKNQKQINDLMENLLESTS